jgi:hypothetical protein
MKSNRSKIKFQNIVSTLILAKIATKEANIGDAKITILFYHSGESNETGKARVARHQ